MADFQSKADRADDDVARKCFTFSELSFFLTELAFPRYLRKAGDATLSWAWSMWRTVVATTANYHALESCKNFTVLGRKACIGAI